LDIGLGSLDAPSKLANPLLSMNVNITNLKQRPVVYTLFVFCIFEGTACSNFGSITKSIAVLNSQDVLRSQEAEIPTLVHHEPTNIYGGSFFSTLKDAFRKGHNYVKKHKLLSKGLSLIPDSRVQSAARAADMLGYGVRAGGDVVTMPRYYENLEELYSRGGKRKKSKSKSKSRGKGKKMSRRGLKRRGGSLDDQKQCEDNLNDNDYSGSESDEIYETQ
jgi:hypothetical protein